MKNMHAESNVHSEKIIETLDAKSNVRYAKTQERFDEYIQR